MSITSTRKISIRPRLNSKQIGSLSLMGAFKRFAK